MNFFTVYYATIIFLEKIYNYLMIFKNKINVNPVTKHHVIKSKLMVITTIVLVIEYW